MNNEIQPKLYLCATPIGNLSDVTDRVRNTLAAVEKIYCEDTRNTVKLLNALAVKKPLESCHEHNEQQRAGQIAEEVSGGKAVAFVSDAGMPGVSDPGSRLIAEFIKRGLPFEVLPGASAMVTAWVMSGLPTEKLYFAGFLPRSGAERTDAIEKLLAADATAAIYESPLRVGGTLADIKTALAGGDRPCVLVREITKAFEECIRGTVSSLAERFSAEPLRGECVLLIGGADPKEAAENSNKKLEPLLLALLEEGLSVKSAAKIAAEALDLPKNAVYKRAMELSEKE
jgi:probable S-adenosylmethionine-dependent methyltransferase, YraL family